MGRRRRAPRAAAAARVATARRTPRPTARPGRSCSAAPTPGRRTGGVSQFSGDVTYWSYAVPLTIGTSYVLNDKVEVCGTVGVVVLLSHEPWARTCGSGLPGSVGDTAAVTKPWLQYHWIGLAGSALQSTYGAPASGLGRHEDAVPVGRVQHAPGGPLDGTADRGLLHRDAADDRLAQAEGVPAADVPRDRQRLVADGAVDLARPRVELGDVAGAPVPAERTGLQRRDLRDREQPDRVDVDRRAVVHVAGVGVLAALDQRSELGRRRRAGEADRDVAAGDVRDVDPASRGRTASFCVLRGTLSRVTIYTERERAIGPTSAEAAQSPVE